MIRKLALILLAAATAPVLAQPPEVYTTGFRPSTTTAYVYLRNPSNQPLTLTSLSIDGHEESPTPWPLDPSRKSHWFDFLATGQVAQLRINLRDRKLAAPITITATTSAGPVTAKISPESPTISLADITYAKDGSSAAIFVSTNSPVTHLLLDGTDVTKDSDLRAAAPHQNTALITYRPKSPLARGAYHTWEVTTADHRRAIYTSRVVTNDFIIGTYGQPNFPLYHDSGINHYISFGRIPPTKVSELGALGMTAAPVPFINGQIDPKTKEYKPLDTEATTANLKALSEISNPKSEIRNPNAPIAFYSAPDEPDGSDHPLGVGTHGRSIIAMRQLAQQIDPATPTFVQIDNTYRPDNYHVYAESMDYSATHRYNLGQEFLAEDRSAMQELRSSTAPQPYLWITQLYPIREKSGEHSNYNGRHPLPAEMHIQMLEALAGGTKGFIHYIHSGSKGGRGGSGLDTALWSAMIPMHQQIAAVGSVAVRSSPVSWATSSDPRVHTQALLADPDNILLVLTNNAIQSTKTDCTVPDITGATVAVNLPPYCHITKVTEVLPAGKTRDAEFKQQNNLLTVRPTSLNVGTIYWLQGTK